MPAECLPGVIPRRLAPRCPHSLSLSYSHLNSKEDRESLFWEPAQPTTHKGRAQYPYPKFLGFQILRPKPLPIPSSHSPPLSTPETHPFSTKGRITSAQTGSFLRSFPFLAWTPWIWRRVQWCPRALASGTQSLIFTTQPEGKVVGGASGLYLTWS